MAKNNTEFKISWLDAFYPYSEYEITGNQLVMAGDDNKVNASILTQTVVAESNSGYDKKQEGGSKKNFRISSKNKKEGFRELEKKVDEYFRNGGKLGKKKNGKDEILVLSLEGLEKGKKFIKIYRKKNM